ncbi:MAG TPA: gluconokinase [Solirubrobacteraceae bacterium]|jgi:gluconokinase|nr:gluconokinase [Solirubrobacteraceae bacterium]
MAVSAVVMMGVSGAGKSTIARRLAVELGWDFAEGDDLHPAANVAKMAAGEPLTDADREPWLEAVAGWIDAEISAGRHGVITCSALKRSYRDLLRRPQVLFVYLSVPRVELERRMRNRRGHYMPASLLASQLDTLEPPRDDESALTVAADDDPDHNVALIRARLAAV